MRGPHISTQDLYKKTWVDKDCFLNLKKTGDRNFRKRDRLTRDIILVTWARKATI